MTKPQRIRLLAQSHFKHLSGRSDHPHTPDMRPFLAVDLRYRLVLLCLYDKRSLEEIKDALPWVKETDIRLTSHRIQSSIQRLYAAYDDPTMWLNPGLLSGEALAGDLTKPDTPFPHITRTIPDDIERQFRQAYFVEVPLLLFGTHVPPSVYALGLQKRMVIYLLVVEELSRIEVQKLLGVSKWMIDTSLNQMIQAIGGKVS